MRRILTVRDLIASLETLDQKLPVLIPNDNSTDYQGEFVFINHVKAIDVTNNSENDIEIVEVHQPNADRRGFFTAVAIVRV